MRVPLFMLVMLLVMVSAANQVLAASPTPHKTVVLELFTSQGCSSCPPADALLHRLSAEDPSLLPLSFHVHYWDSLGWKDPFSSTANTARQNAYAQSFGDSQVYTPELVVDGMSGVVGSQENAVRNVIAKAKAEQSAVKVTIDAPSHDGHLNISVSQVQQDVGNAEVWAVRFNRSAQTAVKNGENGGRTLESINNVLSLTSLGTLNKGKGHFTIDAPKNASEGVAVIVQKPNHGQVLGAASS